MLSHGASHRRGRGGSRGRARGRGGLVGRRCGVVDGVGLRELGGLLRQLVEEALQLGRQVVGGLVDGRSVGAP
jgi:hypothetical protein